MSFELSPFENVLLIPQNPTQITFQITFLLNLPTWVLWYATLFVPRFYHLTNSTCNLNTFLPTRFPGGSDDKVSACNAGDLGSVPGLGRSPGEGNGNPLQFSCLENPMDRGAWWATVHGVAKSRTRLNDFFFSPLDISSLREGIISQSFLYILCLPSSHTVEYTVEEMFVGQMSGWMNELICCLRRQWLVKEVHDKTFQILLANFTCKWRAECTFHLHLYNDHN